MRTPLAALAAGAAILAGTLSVATPASAGVKVGTLTCRSAGTLREVFSSSQTVLCTYRPAFRSAITETYVGTLDVYGVDLGITGRTAMVWTVVAASFEAGEPASLRGRYYGTNVEAAFAAGLGGRALVGGPERGYTLQPSSIQIHEGVNASIGVSRLTLEDAGPAGVVYKP